MQVYKISPIVKYSPFFELTYISKHEFDPGNIVEIDFNNKKIKGIVLERFSLKDAKVEIRKSSFKTKRIDSEEVEFFPKNNFEIVKNFSKEFLISVGELINFLESEKADIESSTVTYFPDDLSYKLFKKKNKDKVVLKGAEVFSALDKIKKLIIKDFSFSKYLTFQSPHISRLYLLFEFLKNSKVEELILETDFLGVSEKVFLNDNVKSGKLFGKIKLEVKEKKDRSKKFFANVGKDKNGEEEILAKEVLEKILSANGKTFLFVLSSGFSSAIFCNDCHKPYACERCGHNFSLLKEDEEQFLFCKSCKNKKPLKTDQYVICKHCGSWRMFPYGAGGQKVLDFLSSQINPPKIVLVDESQKKFTPKRIHDTVEDFFEDKEKRILIGTIRTLKALEDKKLENVVMVSAGNLVKGKSFDSDERLMSLISSLENISENLYINRRSGDEISLDQYKNREKFLEEEVIARKSANLPPFGKVVTLTFNYKQKRGLDKFLMKDLEIQKTGEERKGQTYTYYWVVKENILEKNSQLFKYLRNFGDLTVSDTIYTSSVLGKK